MDTGHWTLDTGQLGDNEQGGLLRTSHFALRRCHEIVTRGEIGDGGAAVLLYQSGDLGQALASTSVYHKDAHQREAAGVLPKRETKEEERRWMVDGGWGIME